MVVPLIENIANHCPIVHLLAHSFALVLSPLHDSIEKGKLRVQIQVPPTDDKLESAQLDVTREAKALSISQPFCGPLYGALTESYLNDL